jgi:hypothetical protein
MLKKVAKIPAQASTPRAVFSLFFWHSSFYRAQITLFECTQRFPRATSIVGGHIRCPGGLSSGLRRNPAHLRRGFWLVSQITKPHIYTNFLTFIILSSTDQVVERTQCSTVATSVVEGCIRCVGGLSPLLGHNPAHSRWGFWLVSQISKPQFLHYLFLTFTVSLSTDHLV